MLFTASALRHSLLAMALTFALPALAAEKQRIEKEGDIPRFEYAISDPLESVVRDKALFAKATEKMRTDMESVVAKYNISDKAALRRYLSTLMLLDFLLGNYDATLALSDQVRSLEDKPADKLLSGLRLRSMVSAVQETGSINTPPYFEAVGKAILKELDAYPFELIANDLKGYKASAEMMGEGRVMGNVRDVLQAALDKNHGILTSDYAPALISARYALETALPLKQTLIATYGAYLNANKLVKADIWANRQISLPTQGNYSEVRVGVWDSGVDTHLYPKQLAIDAKGKPAVLAFDLESKPTKGELFPIPVELQPQMPKLLSQTQGFSDLQSNIDSTEAGEVRQFLANLKSEQFKSVAEGLGLAANYVHGTHVAGVVLDGNPWARLVTARISFGYKLLPDPCPSKALTERVAQTHLASVSFFKQQKVRVVNMSWGGSVKEGEEALEKCGIGKTPAERQQLARSYFEIEKSALIKALSSAPGILFVTAAGNSNPDATFSDSIPSSLVLPNLLTVGSADKAGDEADFTRYGPTVTLHANGYQVESFLPGGARAALSGTSMAAPHVTNLATKLLAAKPELTPTQVIALIRDSADVSADGRRKLLNPAKALGSL